VGSLGRILCTGLAALALSSCSIVDNFSGRAVNYNLVAEQAQQQALLLNIVRASLNRPMQFTTLSSITGTASETGNSTLSVPFGHHRPTAGVSPDILGLSGTVSGGPTFTVPVLDTQEFYEGELKPLTGQEYRFFLDEGITPSVLFYMFVDSIELSVAGSKPAKTFVFHSSVGDDFDLARYEAVAVYLLSLGLGVEEMRRSTAVGPEITAAQLKDIRDIAQLTNAGLKIEPVRAGERRAATDEGISGALAKPTKAPVEAKATGRYQIEKNTTTYRPCFSLQRGAAAVIDPSLVCGSNDATDTNTEQTGNLSRMGGFTAPDLANELDKIRATYVATLQQKGQTAIAAQIATLPSLPPGGKLQLRLYMRSPEAILHYLGSVVARYLYPTFDARRVIRVKIGEPYLPYPATPCPSVDDPSAPGDVAPGYRCENLFVLSLGDAGASPLSVDYNGKTYSVPADDHINGRTMRMLDLVKQIVALHTSAKELPASNVLNIIGGPAP
jgi:hypothetical protein